MFPDGGFFAAIEKVLSQVSALVCGAVALAIYLVLDSIPADWRWLARALMLGFAFIGAAKLLDGSVREVRAYLRRRGVEERLKRRKTEAIAEANAEEERRKKAEQQEAEQKRAKEAERRRIALERLDHLSPEEIGFIWLALERRSQTIFGWVHSHPGRSLQMKGLVQPEGSTGHEDHWPWVFPDFVWKVLLERRDEFINKHLDNEREKQRRNRAR
jgi:proteasome lid subunit RPN8/RPN11